MVGKEPELSKRETMQRIGRLFLLRHRITLSGDLSSPSDFYWEKPDCELIYRTVAESLEMQSRVVSADSNMYFCWDYCTF